MCFRPFVQYAAIRWFERCSARTLICSVTSTLQEKMKECPTSYHILVLQWNALTVICICMYEYKHTSICARIKKSWFRIPVTRCDFSRVQRPCSNPTAYFCRIFTRHNETTHACDGVDRRYRATVSILLQNVSTQQQHIDAQSHVQLNDISTTTIDYRENLNTYINDIQSVGNDR